MMSSGDENFIATVIWEKVYSPKSSANYLSENHDYILVYAKTKDQLEDVVSSHGRKRRMHVTQIRITIRAKIGSQATFGEELLQQGTSIRSSAQSGRSDRQAAGWSLLSVSRKSSGISTRTSASGGVQDGDNVTGR